MAEKETETNALSVLDTNLDDLIGTDTGTNSNNNRPTDTSNLINLLDITEDGIDPRLKLLSHSSRTSLHKCPRKYQLYRLSSDTISLEDSKEMEQALTFAYGTAVGEGMASALEGRSEEEIILDLFLAWPVDLLDENTRQKKSFWLAIHAVQKFLQLRQDGFLDEYELVIYKGKPAVELSFQVILPDGYTYRGFVDAVLRHKQTGEILVLEAKTSSGTANAAMYKNSGQALGYSVVLDILFPDLSSYIVLYLVYETKSYEYKELPFTKSLLQRALWLQELLIDTQIVNLYGSYGSYGSSFPMHGEACFDFFRDCEYLSLCTLQTANLTKPLTQNMLDRIEKDRESYQFTVSFEELVAAQIEKGQAGEIG